MKIQETMYVVRASVQTREKDFIDGPRSTQRSIFRDHNKYNASSLPKHMVVRGPTSNIVQRKLTKAVVCGGQHCRHDRGDPFVAHGFQILVANDREVHGLKKVRVEAVTRVTAESGEL